MTARAVAVLREALDLDVSERAELAATLLESLEPACEPHEIEQAWRDEVARRVGAIDRGEVELVPWETVREELIARLHGRG